MLCPLSYGGKLEVRGGRPGSNRRREDHYLECCRYTTATMIGKDLHKADGVAVQATGMIGVEPTTTRWTGEGSNH